MIKTKEDFTKFLRENTNKEDWKDSRTLLRLNMNTDMKTFLSFGTCWDEGNNCCFVRVSTRGDGDYIVSFDDVFGVRTKVSYEKVEFKDIYKYVGLNNSGLYQKLDGGDYSQLNCVDDLFTYKSELYTKVETPITERDEFIGRFNREVCDHFAFDVTHVAGKLFDAGCRFK